MKREQLVKEIIALHGYKKIAEIGVLRGAFSAHLLSTNPDELHLIDLWQSYAEFKDYGSYTNGDWESMFKKVTVRFNLPNVTIHRCSSLEATSRFADGSLDLVYLDANHSLDYIREDLNAWIKKIRKGVMISGHDYQITKPVVDAFALGLNLTPIITEEKTTASYFIKI